MKISTGAVQRWLALLVALLVLFILSSATKGASSSIIFVNTNVTSNTSWDSQNVYVLTSAIRVLSGVKLTIEPGTVIKGQESTRLIVEGMLDAKGTPANNIVFTSFKDDTHGGDTNNDGAASAPAPNDWGWVEFTDSSVDNQNYLEYCRVRYGGYVWNYHTGGVFLNSASPAIRNCSFEHNYPYGIAISTGSFPVATDNTYTDNWANGIGVLGGSITTSGSWTSIDAPYILNDNIVVVEGGALTLSPGVIIKGRPSTRLIVSGVLDARGTPDQPIVFTSFKDDTHGGDTNNDGAASTPAPNDWGWVEFTDSSVDNQNYLEYCRVRYGGYVWNYHTGGVFLDAASPTIRNCSIADNHIGIYTRGSVSPVIVENSISNNEEYGIYNASPPTVVMAEDNWWGDVSGPYDPSDDPDDPTRLVNASGKGDMVSDFIDYGPWRNMLEFAYSMYIPGVMR